MQVNQSKYWHCINKHIFPISVSKEDFLFWVLYLTVNSTPSLFCFSSDISVPISNISCPGGSGLLPHLWQVFPGLQCGAGICRLDLICSPGNTENSCWPQQKSHCPPAGQSIDPCHKNKLMKLKSLSTLLCVFCRFRTIPWRGFVCVWPWWSLCSCLSKEAQSLTIFTACCLSLYGTLSLKSE